MGTVIYVYLSGPMIDHFAIVTSLVITDVLFVWTAVSGTSYVLRIETR